MAVAFNSTDAIIAHGQIERTGSVLVKNAAHVEIDKDGIFKDLQNVGKIAVPVGGISPPNLRERLIDKGQVGIPIENRHGLIQGKTVELEERNIQRIRSTASVEIVRMENDFVHRENLGSLIRVGELVGPCTDGRVGLVVEIADTMRCC